MPCGHLKYVLVCFIVSPNMSTYDSSRWDGLVFYFACGARKAQNINSSTAAVK